MKGNQLQQIILRYILQTLFYVCCGGSGVSFLRLLITLSLEFFWRLSVVFEHFYGEV